MSLMEYEENPVTILAAVQNARDPAALAHRISAKFREGAVTMAASLQSDGRTVGIAGHLSFRAPARKQPPAWILTNAKKDLAKIIDQAITERSDSFYEKLCHLIWEVNGAYCKVFLTLKVRRNRFEYETEPKDYNQNIKKKIL